MPNLVLLRHGQSQWNLENRFTGWVDADLSARGEAEAARAGDLAAEAGLAFDVVFTSVQTRAIRTAEIALRRAGQLWIPVARSWRLNERHYGALTGLDKAQTAARHGEAQVRIWRRSYDIAPPPIAEPDPWRIAEDRRYRGIAVPRAESLKDTLGRVVPYWREALAPALSDGRTVLVSAHGNSLRALVKHVFSVADEAITGIEIPTGNPLALRLDHALAPTAAAYLEESRAAPLPPLT